MPFPVNNNGGLAPTRLDSDYARSQAERAARSAQDRAESGDRAQVGARSKVAATENAESRIETPDRASEIAEALKRAIQDQPAVFAAAHGQSSPQAVLAALRG